MLYAIGACGVDRLHNPLSSGVDIVKDQCGLLIGTGVHEKDGPKLKGESTSQAAWTVCTYAFRAHARTHARHQWSFLGCRGENVGSLWLFDFSLSCKIFLQPIYVSFRMSLHRYYL